MLYCSISVSYTHLWCVSKMVIATDLGTIMLKDLCFDTNWQDVKEGVKLFWPVSYTHLDVYKRQVGTRQRGIFSFSKENIPLTPPRERTRGVPLDPRHWGIAAWMTARAAQCGCCLLYTSEKVRHLPRGWEKFAHPVKKCKLFLPSRKKVCYTLSD